MTGATITHGAMLGLAASDDDGALRSRATRLTIALAALLVGLLSALALPASGSAAGTTERIVFASDLDGDYEIYSMKPDGTDERKLTDNSAEDEFPRVSPDGERIAFSSDRDGNTEIYVMKATGAGPTRLTHDSARDEYPSWSPDGTKIAFASTRDGDFEIYTMNANGSAETRLAGSGVTDAHPSWSPDGTKIAFSSTRDGNYNVYVMSATGAAETGVTTDSGDDLFPAWSPDGTRITFASDRDGAGFEIYSMTAAGAAQTRLTTNSADDRLSRYSPDGTKIAFQSSRDESAEIYKMNANGSSQTPLTTNGATDAAPHWALVDMTPPAKPVITSMPADGTKSTDATFTWAGAETGGAFECKLDGSSFASCASPKSYSGLANGEHTFQVRQIDGAGNAGPAASYTWSINAVRSDDCTDPEATVTDGFVGDTYVMIRVATPSESETWVCVQASNQTAGEPFGGKFVVDASNTPGTPSVEPIAECQEPSDGNLSAHPHPIDGEFGDPSAAGYLKVALDSFTDGSVVRACIHATANPGGSLGRQVVIPFGDDTVRAVRFEPDTIPAVVPDPDDPPIEPSGECQENDESPGYQRVLNSDVGDEHLWLDTWRESDSRAHLCVRNEGTATVGGRITLDTAGGLGITPVIEVHDDMTGCTLNVFKSDAFETEIRRSSETANPASLCVRHGTSEKRATVGTSGSGQPGIVTWTPDRDTPIPPLP